MTALELYSLPPPQDNVAALRQWRDKVNYIRNQIGPKDRPDPGLLAKWLYDRLKKHPMMRRHVDKIRDAPEHSEMLTFDWLWGKLNQCLHESQQEANALSIQEALRKGPAKKPSNTSDPPGMTAKPSKGGKDGKGKGKGKPDGKGKGTSGSGGGNPKPSNSDKPKSTSKSSELTPAQKADMPCIYFAQGKCFREKCPFKHSGASSGSGSNPSAKPAAKPKTNPVVAKPGMVALLATTIAAATATTAPSTMPHYLDFVGDTGAGEWLGSIGALQRQGINHSECQSWLGTSFNPLRFSTGGGAQSASQTIGIKTEESKSTHNMYVLQDCPLVMSIGHLVANEHYSFHWEPSQLPWLESPNGECIVAHRVDHNVPIFRLQCSLTHGLPSLPTTGGDSESVPKDKSTLDEMGEIVRDDSPDPAEPEVVPAHRADDEGGSKGAGDEGGDEDERWTDELPPNHLMTHLPKSRRCNTCLQAKLRESPHKRRGNERQVLRKAREVEEPSAPLERIAVDFLVARDLIGQTGDEVALVMVDKFSGLIGIHPCSDRSTEEVIKGLQHFCGRHAPGIVEVSSDREKGILKAIKELGFVSNPSPPNMDIKNPVAESAIRTVKGSVSSMLLHAGMKPDLWPLAARAFEQAYGVNTMSRIMTDPPTTCFESFHGYPYEGYMIPFGALVWYRDTSAKSFAPRGAPAVYLGVELINGMKFKGNHIVWPIDHVKRDLVTVRVVRTLAFPQGRWQFPMRKVGNTDGDGSLDSLDDLKPPPDLETLEEGGEEENGKGSGRDNPKEPSKRPDSLLEKEPLSGSKSLDGYPEPKTRNRSITSMRIAIHGATKKCPGCKEGSYNHTGECRKRFNELIDIVEPLSKDKNSAPGPKGKGVSGEEVLSHNPEPALRAVSGGDDEDWESGSLDYVPTTPTQSDVEGPIFIEDDSEDEVRSIDPYMGGASETSGAFAASNAIATGSRVSELVEGLEKGPFVVASIFFDAVEIGGKDETNLSSKLAIAMNAVPKPKPKRPKGGVAWFVEFACSKDSACSRVAKERGIPYIGFSKETCDLSNPHHIQQIRLWVRERKDLGERVHLWGSLPCTSWSSWQYLNSHVLDEDFHERLLEKRQESKQMVSDFSDLADESLETGGSASFEWPRQCSGWGEIDELIHMITKHDMISSHPCGCSFSLEIKGRRPKKPWRIVSTNERLSVEMESRRCRHPKGFKHDPLEGGELSYLSGFYNREMATSILCSLFPEKFLEGIPSFPIVAHDHGEEGLPLNAERIFEQLGEGRLLHNAQALVHRVLTKKQIREDPQAIEAIKKEVADVRSMGVWDDTSVVEYEELKSWAKQNKEEIHIAEVKEIGTIKNDELGPSLSQHKGRLVFRGDLTRNQDGLPAKFRELHSQPASIMTIAMVLFYGMVGSNCVFIADAKKAYLQAVLRSLIPTWVLLPESCWLPEWVGRFWKPAVRLLRPLYGHPEAGDDWFHYLSDVMKELDFVTVENFPSLWWNNHTGLMVAAYVDDIVCAGCPDKVSAFWAILKTKIEIDGVEVPGRYLGRDHDIKEVAEGKSLFMSMAEYCRSAVELYLQAVGHNQLKHVHTPYLNESELNASDWEAKGSLGERSASILMKILWLARLSRPDLSHGVTKLASGITRWSINHDKMLHRLVAYMNGTIEYGVHCFVHRNPSTLELHLFTDADLGGDVTTMKSHTGIYLCVMSPNGTMFPISWTSRRQQCVSKSTTESEIVALHDGLYSDAIPVQTVLQLVFRRDIPLIIHEDNQACIQILNAGYSARLKSMNRTHKLSIAGIHETIRDLGLELRYTVSDEQLADMFTKALAKVKFLAALNKLRIGTQSQEFTQENRSPKP